MKLIIQIPCFNEERQLPDMLADLPRRVPGFASVEWLVIDDGSTDGTVAAAWAGGVDHILRLPHNQGLASAFSAGLEEALRLGADVIVNTDADNQYRADAIPGLVRPILDGEAQMVIGARPIRDIAHFSPAKKRLQRIGSWVVHLAAGLDAPDAPSGFRAISRDAAFRLYVFSRHTYTLETLIQAGRLNIPVAWAPVGVNPPTRESRLMRTSLGYVLRSANTIIRIFALYNPLRFFFLISLIFLTPGIGAFARFLALYAMGDGQGHVQSLVIGAGLLAAGMMTLVGGVIADIIGANRMLLAEIRSRLLRSELEGGAAPALRPLAERAGP